jgi:hypothetical protein
LPCFNRVEDDFQLALYDCPTRRARRRLAPANRLCRNAVKQTPAPIYLTSAMQSVPECSQRKALWERYHVSLRAYINATDALDQVGHGPEFDGAYNKAMWARLAFERLREEYIQHLSDHDCGQELHLSARRELI